MNCIIVLQLAFFPRPSVSLVLGYIEVTFEILVFTFPARK
jgi:hypothetical protein